MTRIVLTLVLSFAISMEASINFVRIRKTGTNSINHLLEQVFSEGEIYPNVRGTGKIDEIDDKNIARSQLRKMPTIDYLLVNRHYPLWFFQRKDPDYDKSFFFTSLRDPIQRVISQYFFRKKVRPNKNHELLGIHPNVMCKMLSSSPDLKGEALLQSAIEGLAKMDHIIFLDDFEYGVTTLFEKLGLEMPEPVPHRNTTKKKPIEPEIIEKLKKIHSLDIRLYNYAKETYGRKL